MLNKKRTIAVLCHQGMGDTLMAVPLLRNCDEILSTNDNLIVLVKSQLEVDVLKTVPWRNIVEVWTVERGNFKDYIRLVKTIFTLRAKHPNILLAPLLVDRFKNAIWMRLINAQISVGPEGRWSKIAFKRRVQVKPGMHRVEFFIKCGVAAGLPDVRKPDVRLPVSSEIRFKARLKIPDWSPEQYWIALGPGSGIREAFKRWPTRHFQKLIEMLLKHSAQIRIALFGNLSEKIILESILQGVNIEPSRCAIYASNNFQEALALLTFCHCMIAGCAGPMHMAAAAGIPVVGLYGPSNPGFEGAYSLFHYPIRVGLECSPCYRLGFIQGCGEPLCMSLLEPEMVFRAVLHMLEGLPAPPVPWTPYTRAIQASGPSICL